MDTKYDFLLSKPFAYKGIYDNIDVAENSLSAIKRAISHDFAVTIDVNMCASGELVVFDGDNTLAMCGISSKISKLSLEEIDTLPLFATGDHIPLAESVLAIIPAGTPLIITVNSKHNYSVIIDKIIEIIGDKHIDYAITSVYPQVVTYLMDKYPSVIRGQIVFAPKHRLLFNRRRLNKLYYAKYNSPDFIAFDPVNNANRHIIKYILDHPNNPAISWVIKSDKDIDTAISLSHNFAFKNFLPVAKKEEN